MPRPTALSKISTQALQAELERRVRRLADLLKLRDDVDRQIEELKTLAGQFGKAVAAEAPVLQVGRKRGRKPRADEKAVAKPMTQMKGTRSQYDQTADQFVLGLLGGGKVLTSQELGQAWLTAGRKGLAAKTLGKLVGEKKLARRKMRGKKGSRYTLA